MIIIEKDRHMTIKKPFFQAHLAYNDWFLSQEFNNSENTFVQLGDLFHTSVPTPEEIDAMISFFERTKFKAIYILGGNHDYSDTLKSYSILPLRNNPRIHLMLSMEQVTLEGKKFLFLPFFKDAENPMKDKYSSIPKELHENDYILFHFEDESISFSKKKTGIDLSYLQGKRIGGHIHCSQKNYELCMPVLSRYDERDERNSLFFIKGDTESFFPVPKFMGYQTVEYPNDIPSADSVYTLWDIKDAPSSKIARSFYREKYPEIMIREIHLKETKSANIQAGQDTIVLSMSDHFHNYIQERTDLPEWCKERLEKTIREQ